MYNTKFHRDGSVTVWNVYEQAWARYDRTYYNQVPDRVLATLEPSERNRVLRHLAGIKCWRITWFDDVGATMRAAWAPRIAVPTGGKRGYPSREAAEAALSRFVGRLGVVGETVVAAHHATIVAERL